jgi:ethanolamine utilization protein EutP (predicted NTPase)
VAAVTVFKRWLLTAPAAVSIFATSSRDDSRMTKWRGNLHMHNEIEVLFQGNK